MCVECKTQLAVQLDGVSDSMSLECETQLAVELDGVSVYSWSVTHSWMGCQYVAGVRDTASWMGCRTVCSWSETQLTGWGVSL